MISSYFSERLDIKYTVYVNKPVFDLQQLHSSDELAAPTGGFDCFACPAHTSILQHVTTQKKGTVICTDVFLYTNRLRGR